MRRLLLAILCLVPLSAQAVPGALFPINDPYEKVLKRYTREGSYYSLQDLHAQVIWYATFASEEFRRSFQGEYDKVYPQGQEYRARERAAMWTKGEAGDSAFFVAIYARKREMMDLGSPKSLEDITLEVGGKSFKPSFIEKISITPFETRFFNYVNLWYYAYKVVFPTDALRDREVPFKLHLNGVSGHSTLNFK